MRQTYKCSMSAQIVSHHCQKKKIYLHYWNVNIPPALVFWLPKQRGHFQITRPMARCFHCKYNQCTGNKKGCRCPITLKGIKGTITLLYYIVLSSSEMHFVYWSATICVACTVSTWFIATCPSIPFVLFVLIFQLTFTALWLSFPLQVNPQNNLCGKSSCLP